VYGHILTKQEFSIHTKLINDIYSVLKRVLLTALRNEIPQEEKLITEIKVEKQDSVNSQERDLDGMRRNRGKLS
jgi:hypothetical protein